MTRQEKNEQFLLSSFLYGGNADYIEDLYSRYKADPKSIDATWASYFGRLEDSSADVKKNAEGPSWARADWPQSANGELVSALDGNWGEITVKAGAVEQSNFHNYPVLRINQAPEIETHIVASEAPPGGVGELANMMLPPTVANAVFAAAGVRVRRLPIDRQALKLANRPAGAT